MGYKAILISTIVDSKLLSSADLEGYKAILISTIVDRIVHTHSKHHRL